LFTFVGASRSHLCDNTAFLFIYEPIVFLVIGNDQLIIAAHCCIFNCRTKIWLYQANDGTKTLPDSYCTQLNHNMGIYRDYRLLCDVTSP